MKADRDELLSLWLADQIKNLVSRDNDKIATNALHLVNNQYNAMNSIIDKPTITPTDTLNFSTHEEDGITGITDNLVFIDIANKEKDVELKPE